MIVYGKSFSVIFLIFIFCTNAPSKTANKENHDFETHFKYAFPDELNGTGFGCKKEGEEMYRRISKSLIVIAANYDCLFKKGKSGDYELEVWRFAKSRNIKRKTKRLKSKEIYGQIESVSVNECNIDITASVRTLYGARFNWSELIYANNLLVTEFMAMIERSGFCDNDLVVPPQYINDEDKN